MFLIIIVWYFFLSNPALEVVPHLCHDHRRLHKSNTGENRLMNKNDMVQCRNKKLGLYFDNDLSRY